MSEDLRCSSASRQCYTPPTEEFYCSHKIQLRYVHAHVVNKRDEFATVQREKEKELSLSCFLLK